MSSSVVSSSRFNLEILPAWVGPFEVEHAGCGLVPHPFQTILTYNSPCSITVAEAVKSLNNYIVPIAQNQHAKLQAFLATTGSNQMVESWDGNSTTCCYPACSILAPRERYQNILVQIPGIGYARPYLVVLKNSYLPLGSIFSEILHEDETLVLRPMTLSELKEGVLDNYLVWVGQTFIATTHDKGVYEATCSWRQAFLNGHVVEVTDSDPLTRTVDNMYNENGKKISPPPGLPIPKEWADKQLEVEATTAIVELSGEETATRGRTPTQTLHPDGRSGSDAARKRAASEDWRLQLEKASGSEYESSVWDSPCPPRGWCPRAPPAHTLPRPTFLSKIGEKKNGMPSTKSNVTPQTPIQPTSVAAASTLGRSRFAGFFIKREEAKAQQAKKSARVDSVSSLDEGNQTKWIYGGVDIDTVKNDQVELLPPAEIIPGRAFRQQSPPTIQQRPTFKGSMFPCGSSGMPMRCDGGNDAEALQAQLDPFVAVVKPARCGTWPGAYPCHQSPGTYSSGSPPTEPLSVPVSPEFFERRVFARPEEVEDKSEIDEFVTPDIGKLQEEFPIYAPGSDSNEENDADGEDEEEDLEIAKDDEPASVYCDAHDYELSNSATDSDYDETDDGEDGDEEDDEEHDLSDDDGDCSSEDDDDIVDSVNGGVSVESPSKFNHYLFYQGIDNALFEGVDLIAPNTFAGVYQLDNGGLPVPFQLQCY